MEWDDRLFTKITSYNPFRVDDISEFMNDEVGIGQFKGDIIIIDTFENKIIDNHTCEWKVLEEF